MKTVAEVIDSIRGSLQSLGSPLSSFSRYSNIYALLRSFSLVIAEQESKLDLVESGSYIYTSTGLALDRKGQEFGINRRLGTPATGSILVTSNISASIPRGLVLTTADQAHQLELTEVLNVSASAESVGYVRSLLSSSLENLPAGTILFSSSYRSLSFVVGKTRSAGSIQGPLTGGTDIETDEELRARILSRAQTKGQTSAAALTSILLEEAPVRKVFIKDAFPSPGQASVYIDSRDSFVLDQVRQLIEMYKPVGLAYSLKPIQPFNVPVSVLIVVAELSAATQIVEQVRAEINTMFASLGMGQFPTIESIAGVCFRVRGVLQVEVLSPSTNVAIPAESAAAISDLNISVRT